MALTNAPTALLQQTQENQNAQQGVPASLSNMSQAMSRRRVGVYHVTSRRRAVSRILATVQSMNRERKAELDMHADTCGANNVACILECTGQVAEVSGFANSLEVLQDVPIFNAARYC